MESGPAVFAGTVFSLFGAALLLWTGARARSRAPVVHGGGAGAVVLYTATGLASVAAGVWCLLSV
ncbi:hypothetical protein GCM10027168_02270 [Streptomyces capparidis]